MPKLWIKLDVDWEEDEKVMDYFDRHSEKEYKNLIRLFLVLGEFGGRIEYKANNGHRLKFRHRMKMSDKAAEAFIARCVECDILDGDAWREFGTLCNARALRDGEKRRNRNESAANASAIAAAKRSRRAVADDGDATETAP